MKRFLFICAAVAGVVLFQGVQANAQNADNTVVTPLPKPPHPLPKLTHFPVPASQYDQYVQWYLTVLRSMPARMHVSQGDVDSVILLLKDCSSKIEADGYVTKREMDYCHNVMIAKLHEVATPYMLEHAGDL